jgi:MFS family permease
VGTSVGTIIWSLATFMTAIVSGFGLIILSRILLGIAEAPAFPGSSKATGYWFPVKERGLATSIFDAAAKFSSVIGLPLVAGYVADATGSFALNFVIAGVILVLGILSYLFLLGRIEPIPTPDTIVETPPVEMETRRAS